MKKMVILSAAYPEGNQPYRAVFIQDQIRALREEWKITFVCPRIFPETPLREREKNLEIRRFDYFTGGKRLKEHGKPPLLGGASFLLSGWNTLVKASAGSDLILVHWLLPTGPLGAALSRWKRIPLALYIHGSDLLIYSGKNTLFRALSQWTLNQCPLCWVTNSEMKEILERDFSLSPRRILPCPVPSEFWEVGRKRKVWKGDPPLVLFVGDISRAKGAHTLLEGALKLRREGRLFQLFYLGEGDLRKVLEKRVAREGEEKNIHFLGARSRKEVAHHLGRARVLVLPSRSEGCPLVAQEALAAGVPVVGTDIAGFRDIITPGVHGELISREGGGREIARALEKILDHYDLPLSPPPQIRTIESWKKIIVSDIKENL